MFKVSLPKTRTVLSVVFALILIIYNASWSTAENIFLPPSTSSSSSSMAFQTNSTTIINDASWYDQNGNLLEVGRGGHITKISGMWYWIGSKPSYVWSQGGDIFLYKSSSLGSNSWEFVRQITHFHHDRVGQTSANCQINVHPVYKTTHIHCKMRMFFISTTGIRGNFTRLPTPADPSNLLDWRFGGCTVFKDRDDTMYYVVSRCNRVNNKCIPETRTMFIYRLNDRWTAFDESDPIVVSWVWSNREAPDIFMYNNWFYLSASQTAGWRDSRTWYRRATSLVGLANAQDGEVVFQPANTNAIRSMGCQSRFMIRVGYGRWLFGGTRHTVEAPEEYDAKYGRNVMAPVKFINGVPTIYWRRNFDWKTFDYKTDDFDEHYHSHNNYGHSPKPPCEDIDSFTFVLMNGKTQDCAWITRFNVENRRSKYCGKKNIETNCRKACDNCCDDDLSYTFSLNNGRVQNCTWFTTSEIPGKSTVRRDRYCHSYRNGRYLAEACCETCYR